MELPTTQTTAPAQASTSSPSGPSPRPPPQRVLACVRCQTRKTRCDRVFPCAQCKDAGLADQCVPATLAPRVRRRKRFPERELLARIRKYEHLMRQGGVEFEPLHGYERERDGSTANESPSGRTRSEVSANPSGLRVSDVGDAEKPSGVKCVVPLCAFMESGRISRLTILCAGAC
jgi:hypothetical protein